MKTYSNNFNEMFNFFLNSYRSGLLTFSGVDVVVTYDKDGYNAKETFKRFENGDYKLSPIKTRHPKIVKGVIVGKKAWGLSLDQWTDGISEMCFTKQEILEEFEKLNITIPESLLKDFENRLSKKFHKRYELKQFPFL
ncbi:MAG: hypothetical protein M0R46_10325 [Candidatus Muirbacterium halophilum]|nr:hypothetical protein [Candidatus Muirbacterium halophilum]